MNRCNSCRAERADLCLSGRCEVCCKAQCTASAGQAPHVAPAPAREICPTCEGDPVDPETGDICPTCDGACMIGKLPGPHGPPVAVPPPEARGFVLIHKSGNVDMVLIWRPDTGVAWCPTAHVKQLTGGRPMIYVSRKAADNAAKVHGGIVNPDTFLTAPST